ncbi:MAG: cytochrome c oxidase subunit II [Terriglobia bacterium]
MAENRSGLGFGWAATGFALILVILTFSTIYIFAGRVWWFPEPANSFAEAIDKQFGRTLFICGIVFLLAQLGLAYVILRYRDRGQRAHYSHGNNLLEILWTSAAIVLFLGMGIAAERAWASLYFQGASQGAMQVEVTGQQFIWNFRYPGPDGVFGRTDPERIDERSNPLGLDETDPASQDDIYSQVMVVPVNREIEVILRSKDVTHSFFVRELRFKQDTVPGMTIRLHFTVEKRGEYEIACAELCGLGHYRMNTKLVVLPPGELDRILSSQEELDNWSDERVFRQTAGSGRSPGGEN